MTDTVLDRLDYDQKVGVMSDHHTRSYLMTLHQPWNEE